MDTRRKFIKNGCLACMGIVAGNALLSSCASSLAVLKSSNSAENEISILTSEVLQQKGEMFIVRDKRLDHDILLLKRGEAYKALYLRCTHEGYNLTPTASKIYCNAHGSSFDFDGNVLVEPALKPLKQFAVTKNNEKLIININS